MRNHGTGGLLLVALLMAGSAAAEVKPTMKPDYSKLHYKGDMVSGHRQDSFALPVQAAEKLLGRETDYEAITAMAGNAFAPFRNLTEDCTSHCQLEAVYSDRAMATVAAYVGLKARKLELPAVEGFDVKDVDRPAYLATVARAVRDAMDAGEVVIVLQGWKVKGGPHGFTHWGHAGIATEAEPATGRILGAHMNGHKDNPIHHGSVMWAVAPGEVTLKPPEAEQTMLRQAVDYIRGRGLFAPKEPVVYGLAAMDAWINHMQTVKGYCAPCWGRGQKNWHDAMENGERLLRAARVAAKKLRAMGPPYEAAAKHYDRIAELLAPVKYQEFIGDIDKQKAHAETVLKPVKAELAAAADAIKKALWACAPKIPDRAKLAALARHGHHPEDPFSLTLQAAAAFGREAEYDAIFALSSNCFAPDIRPDEECRSTWRLRGRGQCLDLVADRLGLKVRPLGCFCPKYPQARKGDEVAALVRQALADGEVVITDSGWRHDFMLWGIVTGVRDDGKLTGVTPNGRTDNTFDHLCSFWALSAKTEGLSQREADLATLRRANP